MGSWWRGKALQSWMKFLEGFGVDPQMLLMKSPKLLYLGCHPSTSLVWLLFIFFPSGPSLSATTNISVRSHPNCRKTTITRRKFLYIYLLVKPRKSPSNFPLWTMTSITSCLQFRGNKKSATCSYWSNSSFLLHQDYSRTWKQVYYHNPWRFAHEAFSSWWQCINQPHPVSSKIQHHESMLVAVAL